MAIVQGTEEAQIEKLAAYNYRFELYRYFHVLRYEAPVPIAYHQSQL